MSNTTNYLATDPKRLLDSFKCDCLATERCVCLRKSTSEAYFADNIQDVARTLADVMVICGIHEAKANASIDLIKCAFMHYDEIRHRIDAPPKKRLCKEDLMHEMGRMCLMTRMEAQLTYSIIKRAFKAFYHGKTEGIRNRALEAELLHSQECAWVHAAKRTAQVFASYEGLFLLAQKAYEAQIRCAYKKLYDKLLARPSPLKKSGVCSCKLCSKNRLGDHHLQKSQKSSNKFDLSYYRSAIELHPVLREDMLPSTTCPIRDPKNQVCCDSQSDLSADHQHTNSGKIKIDFELPVCYKCNCPKLVCDCDIDRQTGALTTECSQGPYKCQWVRVDDDDDDVKPDWCITIPEDHQCPVDCQSVTPSQSESCNSECDCSETCECEVEEDSLGFENDSLGTAASEEQELETEEPESEPPYELPDMSQRQPSLQYAGCRVPMNHIIEETITNRPASIAAVEEHQHQTTLIATDPIPPKRGSINPKTRTSTTESKAGPSRRESTTTSNGPQNDRQDIAKLVGELF